VGCFVLYIAIFMYADEKQRWQNRLENIWVGIDERSKKTDTVFTALVNRVSKGAVRVFDTIFGDRTFSLKLVSVSLNASLFIGVSVLVSTMLLGGDPPCLPLVLLLSITPFALAGYVSIRVSGTIVLALCLTPSITLFCLTLWRLPAAQAFAIPISCCLSTAFDIIALIAIRRIISRLQFVSSLWAVFLGSLLLAVIGVGAVLLPPLTMAPVAHFLDYHGHEAPMAAAGLLMFLNGTTLIYCLVPAAALFGLVLHKLSWPLVARFIYPLLDFHVFQNRKILIPLGTAALGVGLGADSWIVQFISSFKP